MNDNFTASNGIIIGELSDPKRWAVNPMNRTTQLDPFEMDALREFFRNKEDARFGIWRSSLDPDWSAVVQEGSNWVMFSHADGERRFSVGPEKENLGAWSGDLRRIAVEYFAHRPWDKARFGEVWVLADQDEVEMPATFQAPGVWVFHGSMTSSQRDGLTITGGRRIWPEVSE